ncbi:hypothetical protein Taro_054079 [Colocasia esculenta]|uniref:Uncharacterized protein n=1 Tax=Colocasia esculenta TaxID=4460 RepID=A0A843XML5_COLES|nr:hypothetical protein [Colocasia esculenta]
MRVKVAATSLHWSQMLLPHPPPSSPHSCSYHYSSPSPPPSSTSSPVSSVGSRRRRRRSFGGGGGGWVDGALTCRAFCPGGDRSPFLDGGTGGIFRSRSVDRMSKLNAEQGKPLRRAASASLTESFFTDGDDEDEEEFVKRLQELALRCQESAAETDSSSENSRCDQSAGDAATDVLQYRERGGSVITVAGGVSSSLFHPASSYSAAHGKPSLAESATPPPWLGIRPEPPDWVEEGRREIVPAAASVERNASSVDLPLSLRILKRKKRWESEGWIREAGESAACSVKKALSSLVFIIRELQSYALQLRSGALFCEDSLQEVLARVHGEVHASFCWLFSHIFACTPTLMVSVMLLLANFTVYSMGHSVAVAAPSMAPSPPQYYATATATLLSRDESQQKPALESRYDAPSVNSFSTGGKTASVGVNGGSGGGGKMGPLAGAADEGRWRDGFSALHQSSTIMPDGISTVPSTGGDGGPSGREEADKTAAVVPVEEEGRAWSRIVDEAARMQAETRDEALMDHETLQQFVSPVVAELVPEDDYPEYLRTELMYQQAISQDPSNAMLLCNFAQFLYVVGHDQDRAEYYFRRAVGVQPPDAEALGRYANFLWLAKNDLGAAEETYLQAIAAEPGNTVHAASYAHFLWNTGGEDTCYPLSGPDEEAEGEEEVY